MRVERRRHARFHAAAHTMLGPPANAFYVAWPPGSVKDKRRSPMGGLALNPERLHFFDTKTQLSI
jgi:hypothetical protein